MYKTGKDNNHRSDYHEEITELLHQRLHTEKI